MFNDEMYDQPPKYECKEVVRLIKYNHHLLLNIINVMYDYIIALMRLHIQLSMPNMYCFSALMLVSYVLITPVTIYNSVLNQNKTKKMNHIKKPLTMKKQTIMIKNPQNTSMVLGLFYRVMEHNRVIDAPNILCPAALRGYTTSFLLKLLKL